MSSPDRSSEPGQIEKKIDGASRTSSKTESNGRLYLSEDEALARARANPSDSTPIYLTFSKADSANPRNWSKARKWYITCFVSMLNVITTILAGDVSSGAMELVEEFPISMEITTLFLSMYILGFALGPLVIAPLSEFYGRNPVYIVTWFLAFIFQLPIALAPNIGTIIVCRFLSGFFGSAPLTNTGGTVSDLWTRDESGKPMSIYGLSSTFGPPLALVVSGYIGQNKGWRWLFWFNLIISGAFWIILVVTIPETRHSIILDKKTKRVQKLMRKENLRAAEQVQDANVDEKKGLRELFTIALTRPIRFLFTEPITLFSALYNGFVYALVYIFNESFPLVFGPGGHGFNVGEVGLSFLGLCVGSLLAAIAYPFIQERYYLKQVAKNNGQSVPEARMYTARIGAIFLPISLFWFAWTSYSSIHWIVPILASALFSAGIYIVILSILSYIVDSYQTYSASALVGVILVRNLFGAGFPLFAVQMYERLGLEWATSLLAFLSILLVPIPFVFFMKGKKIRYNSPWAREHFNSDGNGTH